LDSCDPDTVVSIAPEKVAARRKSYDDARDMGKGKMKVLIFGATGMVGRGVLLECLRDPDVDLVVTLGRTVTGIRDGKLREIEHRDLSNYAGMEESLTGIDACFFCLGVASSGMKEPDYARVTYGYTMAAAEILSRLNPGMTFIFVSGSGTDSSEKGRIMWARVKGRTENALLQLPIQAYMFRPGFIEPMDGIQSKTPMYRKFLHRTHTAVSGSPKNVSESGALYPPAWPGNAQRHSARIP
jgi:uncharacterized protein YbjT (DUF2867 family)